MSRVEVDKRYEKVDLPFYRDNIAPILPDTVLDFHTHLWAPEAFQDPLGQGRAGSKYMVVQREYSIEDLLSDGNALFPDKKFEAVCFGNPTPVADIRKTNSYVAKASAVEELHPLLITGKGLHKAEQLDAQIRTGGFWGYKVFLNWLGNDYGQVTVEEMLGQTEMRLANELRLIVLLHVPRSGRLADPVVQKGVGWLSRSYPQAQIILAHCGRCYMPDQMKAAIGGIKDLENVYLDTSMVMDPVVLEIALDSIGPSRVLFATDLPVANMRGRRVYAMDHWVDLVLPGYPESDFRVCSSNMHATFMVYEIILAIQCAAERAGLSKQATSEIFCQNGRDLLAKVGSNR